MDISDFFNFFFVIKRFCRLLKSCFFLFKLRILVLSDCLRDFFMVRPFIV